jgi:hypothetical protein
MKNTKENKAMKTREHDWTHNYAHSLDGVDYFFVKCRICGESSGYYPTDDFLLPDEFKDEFKNSCLERDKYITDIITPIPEKDRIKQEARRRKTRVNV